MAKLLEYNATLTDRIDLEPTLAIFRVKPDAVVRPAGKSSGPWFVPGQYLTIGMNREVVEGEDDPRPLSVRRPMSIASPPEEEDEVEFYIRYVSHPESDLPLTHVMWPIKVGDRMYCRAVATGKFTIPDTIGEDDGRLKVMVAAGTGLAPFICIARSRVRQGKRLDDLAILHGASYPSSLGYREELEALARDHGLRYLPTISRAREVEGWTGMSGRVESLLQPDRIEDTERALGLDPGTLRPERAVVFICGLQGTIANTVTDLLDRGYIPDNRRLRRALGVDEERKPSVVWEPYDNTPVIDVKDEALVARLKARLAAGLG